MKNSIDRWIRENIQEFIEVERDLWENPELAMQEHYASAKLQGLLKKHGFIVTSGVAGMPTAFAADFGEEGIRLGFSAEFDALDMLSQKVSMVKDPVLEGAPGHGCGHNILGTGAILAAIALRYAVEEKGMKVRIRVFGTPAEELCIGKPFMGRAGLFEGVDAFLDWHPLYFNKCGYEISSAYFNMKFHFKGKTSHGNSPWLGRSALDGALLTGQAIEMLREHIPPGPEDAPNSINYTFPDVGGRSPGVVPEKATLWVIGRANSTEVLQSMMSRVRRCAEAGGMATETTVEEEFVTANHERIPNQVLSQAMYDNMMAVGLPDYTEEEQAFVKEMQKNAGVAATGISREIQPFSGGFISVTDASEYSWVAPYATVWLAAGPGNGWWHNWIITSCMGSEIGVKAMTTAARILAATAADLANDGDLVKRAKEEHDERLGKAKYESLIPENVLPPIHLNEKSQN